MRINTRRIIKILAERDMTKKGLAELCGISTQGIRTIMRRGTCEPRTAGKLARGLGVQLEDIILEEV